MVGKFRAAMNTAKAVKVQQEVNTDIQNAVSTEDDPLVSLTIKVPLSKRNYWQVEAKRSRMTVTEVIVDALETRFGKPDADA